MKALLGAHLRVCEACRRELAAAELLSRTCREGRPASAPDGFVTSAMARLASRELGPQRPGRQAWVLRGMPSLRPALAVAVVLVVAVTIATVLVHRAAAPTDGGAAVVVEGPGADAAFVDQLVSYHEQAASRDPGLDSGVFTASLER